MCNISKSINPYQKRFTGIKAKTYDMKCLFDIDRSEAFQTVISSFIRIIGNGFPINVHIKQLLAAKISKSLFLFVKRDTK